MAVISGLLWASALTGRASMMEQCEPTAPAEPPVVVAAVLMPVTAPVAPGPGGFRLTDARGHSLAIAVPGAVGLGPDLEVLSPVDGLYVQWLSDQDGPAAIDLGGLSSAMGP